MAELGHDASSLAVPPGTFYAAYMACFVLTGDLEGARHLWLRTEGSVRAALPDLVAMWAVSRSLLMRDLASAYAALNGRFGCPVVQELASQVLAWIRRQQTQLISKGYSQLALENLAALLNLSAEEAARQCAELGWTVDLVARVVSPLPFAATDAAEGTAARGASGAGGIDSSVQLISRLSEYVAAFETKGLRVDLSKKEKDEEKAGAAGSV